MFMASAIVACMTSCEPKALTVEDVFVNSTAFGLEKILDERDPQGWDFYDLNDLFNHIRFCALLFVPNMMKYLPSILHGILMIP